MDLGARTAPLLHFWEMLTHRCSHPSGFSLAAPLRLLPPPGYTHVVQADDNLMWQSLSSSCVWICNKCLLCTRHYVGLCTFNLPTHFYLLTIFFGRCLLQPIPSPGLSPSPLTQPASFLLFSLSLSFPPLPPPPLLLDRWRGPVKNSKDLGESWLSGTDEGSPDPRVTVLKSICQGELPKLGHWTL